MMDPFTAGVTVIAILLVLIKVYLKVTEGVCHSKRSMDGRTVIITGGNSGIGLETARELAKRKARVILACRNLGKAYRAKEDIEISTGNSNVDVRHLDLSSLSSVRKFAAEIISAEPRLDVLIHNAVVIPDDKLHLTEDNLELQFATNYFGPFLLTNLLLDLLKRSAPARIILVSSYNYGVHLSIDLDNLNCEKYPRKSFWTYGMTKLAGLIFMRELSKKLSETGVTINALHPGTVWTPVLRHTDSIWKYLYFPLLYPFLKTLKGAAQTSIYLAVSEDVTGVSGKFFHECRELGIVTRVAKDDKVAAKLWEISERLTGLSS